MGIKTVGVLGCGLMGAGIAQVSAAAGFKTIVLELNEDVLKKGLLRIEKFLTDGVAKGKVTEDAKTTTLALKVIKPAVRPRFTAPAGRRGYRSQSGGNAQKL